MTSSAQNSKQVLAQQGSAAVPSYSFLGDQDTGAYRSGANEWSIATNGTQRVVVNANGNVGIGTSTPSTALDVNGVVTVTNSYGGFAALQSAGGTGYRWTLINDGTFRLQSTTNGFSSATTPIHVSSTGNVGIGTTSPAFKLDVDGSVRFGDAGAATFLVNFGTSGVVETYRSAYLYGDGTNVYLFNQQNGALRFGANNADRMCITSAGNVGIGTTLPGALFELYGGTTEDQFRIGTGSAYQYRIGRSNSTGYLNFYGTESGYNGYVFGGVDGERMRITSAGDVGIGTSSPTQKLGVVGGADTWCASFRGLSNSNQVLVGTLSGVATIGVNNSAGTSWADLSINPAGNTYICTVGGNVGIGTTSPGALLDVAGNARFGASISSGTGVSTGDAAIELGGQRTGSGNAFLDLHATSGTDYEARVLRNGGTNGNFSVLNTGTGSFDITQVNAGVLLLQTSNTERVRVHSGGDVSISTSDNGVGSGVGMKFLTSGSCGSVMNDGAAAANSYHLYNENATNNGYRFYVNTNGGIYNYSANNVNLSDERVKKDIEPAGSYLEKICAIQVRTFRYKDQDGDWKNVGVIAQEVEAVAPEFVDADGWIGDPPDGGEPLKAVYDTDIMYAMLKALQELKTEVDKLKGISK